MSALLPVSRARADIRGWQRLLRQRYFLAADSPRSGALRPTLSPRNVRTSSERFATDLLPFATGLGGTGRDCPAWRDEKAARIRRFCGLSGTSQDRTKRVSPNCGSGDGGSTPSPGTNSARPTAAQLSQAQIARLQNRDRRFQSPARPWTVARHETVRWERWGELRPLELAGDNLAQFLFNCVISPIPSQTIRALAPHKSHDPRRISSGHYDP